MKKKLLKNKKKLNAGFKEEIGFEPMKFIKTLS